MQKNMVLITRLTINGSVKKEINRRLGLTNGSYNKPPEQIPEGNRRGAENMLCRFLMGGKNLFFQTSAYFFL